MELLGVRGRDDAVASVERARCVDFDDLVGDAFPRDEDDVDGRGLQAALNLCPRPFHHLRGE
jgi:hypothetical protein